MCGVSGFLDLSRETGSERAADLVTAMSAALTHRGPDASGVWIDPAAGIALGHRRLSIIDVSDAGAQPMVSASGRFVMSYNGEIYNSVDLAGELVASGHRFHGHCDTEVLVEAIDAWGLEPALERANGMFAFALWDRSTRRLHLVRDRLGEKPMYYGWFGNILLFGSELKSLREHPAFDAEIDRDSLAAYLRFNCVPAPRSIFQHVRKVPPASVLTIDSERDPAPLRALAVLVGIDAYASDHIDDDISDGEAIERVEDLVRDAVGLRLRSDVPLGAFLSGGIDSATVVALMQQQSSAPVRTFTIGSTSRAHNEADRAAAIANHLGTRHHELIVTAQDALGVVTRLPEIYDEPFADSSQIPTILVSELARHEVTVSLSGDGGDEVFGGYDRYRLVPRVDARLGGMPMPVRRAAARAARAVPPRTWEMLTAPLPSSLRPQIPATKVAKLAMIAECDSPEAMYDELVSHWHDAESVVRGANERRVPDRGWDGEDVVQQMMLRDTVGYLPDDILVKLDRATMSVSLEGRIPFLDHRLVELMAAMPARIKIRDGRSKWVLRQVLARRVPTELFAGPKSGFGVPIGSWLRTELRPWAEDLLSPGRLAHEGFFDPVSITAKWSDHVRGRRDWGYHLWDVLMFQAWHDAWQSA